MFEPLEFFHFLKNPQYQSIERRETNILWTAIKIYLVLLLFLGLINVLSITILKAFITLPIDETIEIPDNLKKQLWIYLAEVVFIAPILEEIIFRLSLFFNPWNLSISFSILIAVIVHKFLNDIDTILILFLVFILIFRLTMIFKLNLNSFWNKYFKFIIYSSSILFGLVHITNYRFTESYQYLIIPILIFPQLAIGFTLSFTRLYFKKGFLICILIHMIMNIISITINMQQAS